MKVLSVNVGQIRAIESGRLRRTAIDKRPVAGRVPVRALGLGGDAQADTVNHGGPYQAVYVYACEDYDWWRAELGREVRPGVFGDNLTLSGVDVSGALLGERWRIGTVLAEVTGPRIPCGVFRYWMGERGWVRRFAAAGRPGAYLRIVREGEIGAGDRVEIVHRPADRVTVAEGVLAYYGDQAVMRRIIDLPGHSPQWDTRAVRVLGAGDGADGQGAPDGEGVLPDGEGAPGGDARRLDPATPAEEGTVAGRPGGTASAPGPGQVAGSVT
jgi:MOSC domain-containing protein YiiM